MDSTLSEGKHTLADRETAPSILTFEYPTQRSSWLLSKDTAVTGEGGSMGPDEAREMRDIWEMASVSIFQGLGMVIKNLAPVGLHRDNPLSKDGAWLKLLKLPELQCWRGRDRAIIYRIGSLQEVAWRRALF